MAADGRLDAAAVEELLVRFESEVARVEQVPGPTTEAALDAVSTLAALYGEALARVVDTVPREVVRSLAEDELVGHLLLLHGLHPESVEERVGRALKEAEPYLGQDGHAELTGIDAGVARIRVAASGCGTQATVDALADVVLAEAPELAGVTSEKVARKTVISADSLMRRPS